MLSADQDLRGALTRLIAEHGFAPAIATLAAEVDCSETEATVGLHRLADAHALLLHPGSDRPWVVHPFALAPGSCWVQTNRLGYWANCVYCGLGIAAALRCDAVITTRIGGEAKTVEYRIEHGELVRCDDLFHLSTPVARWWDNVIFACSSFQPFHNEAEIETWCARHALPRGAVISMERLWHFASEWYGDYVHKPWRKRTQSETEELFARHGLTDPFWALE